MRSVNRRSSFIRALGHGKSRIGINTQEANRKATYLNLHPPHSLLLSLYPVQCDLTPRSRTQHVARVYLEIRGKLGNGHVDEGFRVCGASCFGYLGVRAFRFRGESGPMQNPYNPKSSRGQHEPFVHVRYCRHFGLRSTPLSLATHGI